MEREKIEELEKAIQEYDKVCEKLDCLNERAFSLEKRITYLRIIQKRG